MEDHTGKNISEDQEVSKEYYDLDNSSEGGKAEGDDGDSAH